MGIVDGQYVGNNDGYCVGKIVGTIDLKTFCFVMKNQNFEKYCDVFEMFIVVYEKIEYNSHLYVSNILKTFW